MSSTGGAGKNSVEAALAGEAAAARVDRGAQGGLDLDERRADLGEAERAIAEVAGEIAEDELDSLGLPKASEVLEIQRELDCDVFQAVREHRRRQGKGGRKKGSINRRSKEFRDFVLSQGGHPGLFLQRVYDRPVEQLAAELGCTKKEALDRQIRCADTLMPFIEGKMPATVNLAVRGDMVLQAATGTGLFEGLDDIEDADFDEEPELLFPQENQGLGDADSEVSD